LAIIGYGSLGARELSFDSDLDLVFLYDPGDGTSQGERPLEAERWFARLAQRMVGLLTAFTPSGKLYEIDTRLRPNGQSGLLVSSIAAFANYQREDAWTWEAQALTRARAVTGDPDLIAQFEEIRRENLCRARDPAALGRDLLEMRARVRDNQPDGFDSGVDIKHAPGGLVDIGFTAQLGVLSLASRSDVLFRERGVSEQLRNLRAVDWLDDEQFDLLQSRLNMLRKLRIEQELVATEARAALEDDCGRGEAVADLFTRLARG
jgi:glutamate-ammonia-ligase adenylyltransferase